MGSLEDLQNLMELLTPVLVLSCLLDRRNPLLFRLALRKNGHHDDEGCRIFQYLIPLLPLALVKRLSLADVGQFLVRLSRYGSAKIVRICWEQFDGIFNLQQDYLKKCLDISASRCDPEAPFVVDFLLHCTPGVSASDFYSLLTDSLRNFAPFVVDVLLNHSRCPGSLSPFIVEEGVTMCPLEVATLNWNWRDAEQIVRSLISRVCAADRSSSTRVLSSLKAAAAESSFEVFMQIWTSVADLRPQLLKRGWGLMLIRCSRRADYEGFAIASFVLDYGCSVDPDFEFLSDCIFIITKNVFACSTRRMWDLFSRKCHAFTWQKDMSCYKECSLAMLACSNRFDGANLLRALNPSVDDLICVRDSQARTALEVACVFGNYDIAASVREVFARNDRLPELFKVFRVEWICQNQADPLGVLQGLNLPRDLAFLTNFGMDNICRLMHIPENRNHLALWAFFKIGYPFERCRAVGMLFGNMAHIENGGLNDMFISTEMFNVALAEMCSPPVPKDGFHLAASNGNMEELRKLMLAKRNPWLPKFNGKLPLDEAKEEEVRTILLEYMEWNPRRPETWLWFGPLFKARVMAFLQVVHRYNGEIFHAFPISKDLRIMLCRYISFTEHICWRCKE